MDKAELQSKLQELHESLQSMDHVDEETRELIAAVSSDLKRVLEPSPEWTAEEMGPVSQRMRELLLRFETDHPHITGLMGRVADSLANLGI